jgi:hypothetical protein
MITACQILFTVVTCVTDPAAPLLTPAAAAALFAASATPYPVQTFDSSGPTVVWTGSGGPTLGPWAWPRPRPRDYYVPRYDGRFVTRGWTGPLTRGGVVSHRSSAQPRHQR